METHSCQKPLHAPILEATILPPDMRPEVATIIVLISSLPPPHQSHLKNMQQKIWYTQSKLSTMFSRTEIVFYVYRPTSLNAECKGFKGARRRVADKGKVPTN